MGGGVTNDECLLLFNSKRIVNLEGTSEHDRVEAQNNANNENELSVLLAFSCPFESIVENETRNEFVRVRTEDELTRRVDVYV